ncbi:MAG TPA: CARDB domain-containing protein [Gaiella sp.]|nr:CARDB domain-containing protein [Gaiella sp.]
MNIVTVHDDDILDFDFVDDETRELPPPDRQGGTRPPGGPTGGRPPAPPPSGPSALTPLLRLAALVALAILVVVLLAVWVQGCAAEDDAVTYGDYMGAVGAVGTDSAKIGTDLATLLTTPGLTQADLETQLGGLVQQQELDVQRARDIDPPGPLTPAHENAVRALDLRVTGLQGLLDTFRATKDTQDATAAGRRLATQGQRLEASDVVWRDLFQGQATQTMATEGVEGVAAPASIFVENSDLYTARSMSSVWQRVHGASTGGGTPTGSHGSALAYTEVQPAGVQLSTTNETTITVSTDLSFEVGVTNSGENQEVGVRVRLTIPGQNRIVKNGTIDVIDPGETKVVTFSDFPDFPFGEGTTVQVNVLPVPGETNTGNNSAEYPVVFSLDEP